MASWPRSRGRRCGAGFPTTPSSRGGTGRGSSLGTPISRQKQAGCSISTVWEWEGEALAEDDYVLSVDEKTSVQARARRHPSLAPAPGRNARVEHEYGRAGALQYFAAWDVHRGKIFGRCEAKTGIEPFGRLVGQVMGSEPHPSACRVFAWSTTVPATAVKPLASGLLPVGRTPSWSNCPSMPPGSTRLVNRPWEARPAVAV